MANLPSLRSKEQIIGDLIDGFLARVKDVNDLNRASIISQFFQAIGQSNFKAAADVISMIDALSVDRATGEALQRLAADANITINPGTYSSGRVKITDLSFNKVSSNVFAGQPAPVAGSTTIYIVDGSKYNTAGGSIFIGRGTPNVEGPLTYISVQPELGGAYWSITLDPSSATTKFHNIGEGVVQAQGGNRNIPSGTLVKTPSGSAVSSVDFITTSPATIPDGETVVTDIPVSANTLGPKGNVPRGAIREAVGLSFTATVFNDNPFVTGVAPDDEDEIRKNIKNAEQAKSRGTEQAIRTAVLGITSQDDLKQVQSSNISRYTDSSAAVIFDDGTGYEPIFSGVGLEQVIDDALGGEPEVQLRKRPIAHARIKSIKEGPFSLPNNSQLTVEVQGVTTTHTFTDGDFRVPSAGTSFEVVSSINGDPNINFSASTADGGSKIVIYPRNRRQNDITVKRLVSNDANDYLGFQNTIQYSLLLYKNDKLLYQDGLTPVIYSRLKSSWSNSIAEGDTLTYSVDGTPPITISLLKADFQEFSITATVNTFTDISIWVSVLNSLMSGVIVSASGEQIAFTSARGETDSASIEILGGTIKDKMFETGVRVYAIGRSSDYTLNNQTGQIGLTNVLGGGDKITAGSSFTRANIITTQLPDGPSSAGNVWMVVDGGVKILPTGLEGSTITTFSKAGTKITITATDPNLNPVGFDGIVAGDWIVAWPEQSDAGNYPTLFAYSGFWRVESVVRGTIIVDDGIASRPPGGAAVLPTDRIIFVRSEAPIQKLSFNVGPISQFVSEVESNIEGVVADVIGSTIRISTLTAGSNGELAIIAADSQGKALGISTEFITQNIPSQKGFIVTSNTEVGMPSFTFSNLGPAISDSEYTETKYEEIGGNRHDFVYINDSYNTAGEDLVNIPNSNENRRVFVSDYDPALSKLTLIPKKFSLQGSTPLKENDRYYLRTGYQFDSTDTATVIVDGDITTKVFNLPVARKVIVNAHSTPTLIDFSADDGESSLELKDTASFAGYEFNDWLAWRRASTVLTDGASYGLRVKYADFGPSGNKIRAGFVYPKTIDETELSLRVNNTEIIDIGIVLPIKTPRTPNWDGTSSFTTDVTRVLGTGKDEVKYTWRVGTEPNLLAGGGGAAVAIGDVALINASADFLPENRDIEASVTNTTSNTFTIETPTGIAISDNVGISSGVNTNKIYTVITDQPHGIEKGDRIGIWDTELADGIISPIDGTYFPTVIDSNTFTVKLNPNVPGGAIFNTAHASNVVTVTTTLPHGLNIGNTIIVSGTESVADGRAVVLDTLNANKFSYIRQGSSPGATGGRFDFQSVGYDYDIQISSLSKVNGNVTVNTVASHNLSPADLVKIDNTSITKWESSIEIQAISNTITLPQGDIAKVPSSGFFTLRYNSAVPQNTAPLPYNATASTVQAALALLTSEKPPNNPLGSGVRVEGSLNTGGFVIIFENAQGAFDHPQVSIINNTLFDATGTNTRSRLRFDTLPSLGTFKLRFDNQVTAPINPLLGNAEIKTQLELLSNIDNVTVTGDPDIGYLVDFGGIWTNINTFGLTVEDSTLLSVSGTSSTVKTIVPNTEPAINNKQTIYIDGVPVDGYFKLSYNGNSTSYIPAATASATTVRLALEALPFINPGDVQVIKTTVLGVSVSFVVEFIGLLAGLPLTAISIANEQTWLIGTSYNINDTVEYNSNNYKSLTALNIGNNPETAPGNWQPIWQPIVGPSFGVSQVIQIRDSNTAIKFDNVTLYNQTKAGDYVTFTGGYLSGNRYSVKNKYIDIADNKYVFVLNTSELLDQVVSSSFDVKSLLGIGSKIDILGAPAAALPQEGRIGVTSAILSIAEIKDVILITSGPDSGSRYTVTGKSNPSKQLIFNDPVSVSLSVNDTFEIRRPIITTVSKLKGNPNIAIPLTWSTVQDGSGSVTYNEGDLATYSGQVYVALIDGASNATPNTPDVTPTDWASTTIDLNGTYIVSSIINDNQFIYSHYHVIGSNTGYDGTATKIKSKGKLARSLGKNGLTLEFAEVATTAQEVVDYLAQNQSDILLAEIEAPYNGSELINTSTRENDVVAGFIYGAITSLSVTKASRIIKVVSDVLVPAGSTVDILLPGYEDYNGRYAVLSSKQVGLNWEQTLQSAIFASSTSTYAITAGSIVGYTDYNTLKDGENSVKFNDFTTLIGSPHFTVKYPWEVIPTIDEEIRLVALTTEHLTSFWNRLVVTGISNVTEIKNSEYGRQAQLTTNKFGSTGSIEITGGPANAVSAALIGSGSELNDKLGVVSIPYELRRGIQSGFWAKLEQTVRLNKDTEFTGDTVVKPFPKGIELISGPGTFQTKRGTTHDETSIFRVEQHGKFVAIINIDGQNIGLEVGGVKEGDWVKFKNTTELAYDVLADYIVDDRVSYTGLNWTCVNTNGISSNVTKPVPDDIWDIEQEYAINSTVAHNGKAYINTTALNKGQYPDDIASSWDLVWENREWAGGNTGIFRVVRVFGSNAFWIENENNIEQMLTLGNILNLSFYSYDSVMPGDTLVVSGNILGAANAGRYRVLDETFSGAAFPTSNLIFTEPLIVEVLPTWSDIVTYSVNELITYNSLNYKSLTSLNTNNQPDLSPTYWLNVPITGVSLGDSYVQVNIEEKDPLKLWKKIFAVGPGESGLAAVLFDSPDLVNRFSSSNGAYIEMQGKIGYDTVPAFGIDAYKYYGGLIKELNKVIYGDPTSPDTYPGWRAAGTDIDIKESIIKRIYISLSVRVRTGIAFSDVRESIKAAVAGYVNNLDVGQSVALSKVIEAASKVNGVSSVVVTSPTYNVSSDSIKVGAQESALIVDPTFDVTVSILGT